MRKNTAEDIWKYVEKSTKEKCWPFTGGTFNGRYGRFFLNGKAVAAHRVCYEICFGPIPQGLFVMHKCNNKLCCNPKHLTIGTNQENQLHAVSSGAWPIGKTGIRGVGFDEKRKYWTAQCYQNGRRVNLYTGPSKEKATKARNDWEKLNLITFE